MADLAMERIEPLRSDLQYLLATSQQQRADQTANRILYALIGVLVAFVLVVETIYTGPMFASVVALIALLYWLLLHEVRRRGLSDSFVVWGFSIVTIVPALLVVLLSSKRKGQSTRDGVDVSVLSRSGFLWGLAVAGTMLPIFENLIIHLSLRRDPRKLDSEGILMRSGKLHLWRDCVEFAPFGVTVYGVGIRGDFSRQLRLTFPNAVVWISTLPRTDSPAYLYTLRMIQKYNIAVG